MTQKDRKQKRRIKKDVKKYTWWQKHGYVEFLLDSRELKNHSTQAVERVQRTMARETMAAFLVRVLAQAVRLGLNRFYLPQRQVL